MIFKLLAVGVLCAVLCATLAELKFGGKRIFAAASMTVILCGALSGAADMVASLLSLSEDAGVGKIGAVALKVVGCGYVFGFVADTCEELGERGIASAVSVSGRIEIFALVFPYFLEICRLGATL